MLFVLRKLLPVLVVAWTLSCPLPVLAEEDSLLSGSPDTAAGVVLTVAKIKERADSIAASSGLDDASRTRLSELYRQSIASLEAVEAYRDAAKQFEATIQNSTQDVVTLRAELEQKSKEKVPEIPGLSGMALEDIGLRLQEAKAERATMGARLAEIRSAFEKEKERPAVIRQLVSEANKRIGEIEAEPPRQQVVGEEPTEFVQARAWVRETRLEQLRAEILMLGQELASQPVRLDELRIREDLAEVNLAAANEKIAFLEAAVNRARLAETEQAKAEALAAERVAVGKHPLVVKLAGLNRQLSEEIDVLAGDIERIEHAEKKAAGQVKKIAQNFSSTRQKIEVSGVSQILGTLLQDQRRNLPDLKVLGKRGKLREHRIAEITLAKFVLEEERNALGDPDAYIANLSADTPPEDSEGIVEELQTLVENRRELTDKAIAVQRAYLQAMAALDFEEQRLSDTVDRYDAFLGKRLLWVRSTEMAGLDTMRRIPGQIREYLDPSKWRQVSAILFDEAVENPVAFLVLVLVIGLRLSRRRLLRVLMDSGRNVGNLLRDSLGDTLRALLCIVLLALPWPLLLWVIGQLLLLADGGTDFTKAAGVVADVVAHLLFQLIALRLLIAPGSVADLHFGWRKKGLERLHADLKWFTPLFVMTSFITVLVIYLSDKWGSGLGRAAFLVTMGLFSFFAFRLTLPSGGTISVLFADKQQSRVFRWRHLWFLMLVFLPLVASGAALAGYMYTALTVIGHIIDTLWFTLLVLVVHQFIVRWLVLNQRRMRLKAARERRRMEQLARAAEDTPDEIEGVATRDIEEPEIDLKALDTASRSMVDNILLLIGVIGIWFIWSDMLPALAILDDITLWSYSKPGVDGLIPITLSSLGLAILIMIMLIIATRQLPAFLELILLQRLDISQGSRYTVVTLTKYLLVAIGISWIFSTLGGSWSEIQWIFAALGVGIGFGLQEIVANFISGLIILFERPIRVGDVVTVGNTDGIVTRIQIRATTIRNWDQRELLVPNKNFITQELLNWSLSDQTTRILIRVGVAYGSNVDRAMLILEEAATSHPRIIGDPAPFVVFEEFGDSALLLSLRCYLDDIDFRLRTITEINQTIYRNLNEAGIEISFPQADVHLDTRRPLDVRIQADHPLDQSR